MAIADNDTYVTDLHRPRSLFSRIFLSPKFMFYPQMLRVVWNNGSLARKGVYGDAEWVQGSLDILRALENIGVKIEIAGMANIGKVEGPAVFVGNHMSTLETFVLPCVIQPLKPVTFIVKTSLITMPVFGHVMRSRNPIVVGRANPRDDLRVVLDEGAKRIASGRSVIVFPQSTRSVVFLPGEFNTLGVKLASRAKVPLIPIALKTDAWGVGKLMKDFGTVDRNKTVHIEFGVPIRIEGRGVEEHAGIVAFIQERLKQWEKEEAR